MTLLITLLSQIAGEEVDLCSLIIKAVMGKVVVSKFV
jgi:hypothetical protein